MPKKPPVKAKAAPRRTNNDIYEVVLDVKEKVIGVEGQMVALQRHVNEEIDLLRGDIAEKLDDDQLLATLTVQLLTNRWFRWLIGGLLTAALASIAVSHWSGPAGEVAQAVIRAMFGRILP